MPTATIIGSGPNGLSAAIVLAAARVSTTVFERNVQIGGACSTAETTLPNFRQDLGSSVYPLGVASPFFRSLPIKIPWIEPTAPCAHPLDDGTAVMLEHSFCELRASEFRSTMKTGVGEFAANTGTQRIM
jgi:phytoene dehydrogenase-like protein